MRSAFAVIGANAKRIITGFSGKYLLNTMQQSDSEGALSNRISGQSTKLSFHAFFQCFTLCLTLVRFY